jgi:hypothetical protein
MQSSSSSRSFKPGLIGASPITDAKAVKSFDCKVQSYSELRFAVLMEEATIATNSLASASKDSANRGSVFAASTSKSIQNADSSASSRLGSTRRPVICSNGPSRSQELPSKGSRRVIALKFFCEFNHGQSEFSGSVLQILMLHRAHILHSALCTFNSPLLSGCDADCAGANPVALTILIDSCCLL